MNKEKILLFILAAVQFTHIVDFMIVMPLGPQLMRLFEITPIQFAVLVSSYTFSAGVIGFLFAFIADRFDRKIILLISYIGFTVGTLFCGFSNSFDVLLAARILTGSFGGVMNALVYSIVADVFPFERRGNAMGVVMSAFSFASALGVPFALFLAGKFNWQFPFYFLGGSGIFIAYGIYRFIPGGMNATAGRSEGEKIYSFLGRIGENPNLRLALLFMFLLVMGQFIVIPFVSPYMVFNMGISELNLTYVYLLGGFATMYSNPVIGRWSDKFGKPKIFTIFAVLSIIPLFLVTNLQQIPLALILFISTIFFVFISGRMVPAMTMITSAVSAQQRGSFMSINSSVQQFSSSIASYVGGLFIYTDAAGKIFNYEIVGYLAIGFTIISIYIGRKIISVE